MSKTIQRGLRFIARGLLYMGDTGFDLPEIRKVFYLRKQRIQGVRFMLTSDGGSITRPSDHPKQRDYSEGLFIQPVDGDFP